jgi:hypothetical protein
MIVLLILSLCSNYKTYCLSNISKTDTSIIIKYKNIEGIFFDKEALQRIGKKTTLSDSLSVINTLNKSIIKRQEEQLDICNQQQTQFNYYIESVNKEKAQMNKKFNLRLASKNILIGLFSSGTTILGILYFLK